MESKDLVRLNGDTSNLPARREEYELPSVYRDMNRWMSQWEQWMDNMMNRTFGLSPLRDWEQRFGWSTGPGSLSSFVPAVNVSENDDELRVTAELPGIDPNDVELTLNRGLLTIRGEKKHESEQNERGGYRMERSFGRFERTISLPEQVDHEKVEANFKNGVLTVVVPKLPELKASARRIQIKSENK